MLFILASLSLIYAPSVLALEEVTLQLKWKHTFQFAGYYAAKEKGFYKERGLEVNIIPATPGQDVIKPVLDGRAHFGVSDNSLLQERNSGKPIVMLSVIFQHSPLVFLTLEKDFTKGIHSIQDNSAMLELSNTEILAFLKKANIDINQMTLVEHSFDPNDLINGKVDLISAYSTDEPFYLEKANLYYKSFSPRILDIDFYGDNLYTSESQIEEHPKRVKAFREASIKGWEYAMNNKEEIIQLILLKYNNQTSYDFLRYQADNMDDLIQPLLVEMGYFSLERWQHIVETYQDLNMLGQDFKLDPFLYDPNPKVALAVFYRSLWIAAIILVCVSTLAFYLLKINRRLDLALLESQNAKNIIWQEANLDSLTNLPNRRNFKNELKSSLDKAKHDKLTVALLYLDLDDFKAINDFYGHDVGDKLLIEAANRLVKTVNKTFGIFRLGGDEFTIIAENLTSYKEIETLSQTILESLSAPYSINKESLYISASIGISLYPEHTSKSDTLLRYADEAMYSSKALGRNQYQIFTQQLHQDILYKMQVIQDLRSALKNNEFELHYQPIVSLNTGDIKKAEALIRWNHPIHGITMPLEFIKIAEETSHIIEIGDWVFKTASSQLKQWMDKLQLDLTMSINTSPAQYQHKNTSLDSWFEHLESLNLPPQNIIIEITESLMMKENTNIEKKLIEFCHQGIQVALDDFGTGYSSLTHLNKFDIDFIKIDKSFIQHLSQHSQPLELCEAIIIMAHKLGLSVIAEGIETEEQRQLLMGIGCDYGQGYLFSSPMPAQAFEALLKSSNSSKEQFKLMSSNNKLGQNKI
ncbi:sensory box protein [Marinomonas sp. MED121]|nr:sensory box protein [Marinomonas sp. MED121]